MKLLRFLMRSSPWRSLAAALVGGFAGLATATLMGLITERIGGATPSPWLSPWSFAGLVAVVLLAGYFSRILVLDLLHGATYELRMNLSRQVAEASLRQVEKIGSGPIFAALSEDINVLTLALTSIPAAFVSLSILVACLGYLGWLSLPLLLGFLAFLALAVGTTRLPERHARRMLSRARVHWDELVAHFRALTDGFKEMKLHRPRRQAFLDGPLETAARLYRRQRFAGSHIYALTNSWSQVLVLLCLGLALFGIPLLPGADTRLLTGYMVTMIYMRGPVVQLLDLLPLFAQAEVSLNKIEGLGLSLARVGAGEVQALPPVEPCRRIELSDLIHNYFREHEERNFLLGPIDLTIDGGELLFLVGGNGSGKTTLVKLLTGLYAPESGEIRYNGEPITEENREWYRQHFTVVFSDFHLFEKLFGLESPARDLDGQAHTYLELLQLDHKVEIENGRLSTLALSQGQRKRLALLTAYLEDRPIYVFDEWAADQDPLFKKVFYRELLPELRSRGKTVVVVSHDDHYYDIADRIVKLDSGVIEKQATKAG